MQEVGIICHCLYVHFTCAHALPVKNIVLTGFGHITLLDLDTIDLSNLNRQFLFKKKDVKQSKALIAAQTAASFNPNVHLHPIHGNIKEPQFDIEWFQGFEIVLNALDNLGESKCSYGFERD